jgi:hypothetical protein
MQNVESSWKPKDATETGTTTRYEAVLNEFGDAGIDVRSVQHWAEHPDWLLRRNRRQAVATFPVFALLLAGSPEKPQHGEVRVAIDDGSPLVETISSNFRVSKRSVRFLRGKGPALIGAAWLESPAALLAAVDMVSPAKLPRNPAEWQVFRDYWVGCGEFLTGLHCTMPSRLPHRDSLFRHMFSGLCAAGYEATAQRLGPLSPGNQQRFSRLKDYFRFVAEWCERGAGICEPNRYVQIAARETLYSELLTRYSVVELVRQSERWHREIARASSVGLDPDADDRLVEWPGLPGLPLCAGELTVFSLTNSIQLQVEGNRLDHCVGTYFRSCLYGESHILSIRNDAGNSLSTAEICLDAVPMGNLLLRVVQHQAFNNTKPTLECEAALAETLEFFRSVDMQSGLRELQAFHIRRYDDVDAQLRAGDGAYSISMMSQVMSKVLRNYSLVLAWLDKRLDEEEGWYRHRNTQAGERLRKCGFEDGLTEDQAFEISWITGNNCWDEGLSTPDSIYERVLGFGYDCLYRCSSCGHSTPIQA